MGTLDGEVIGVLANGIRTNDGHTQSGNDTATILPLAGGRRRPDEKRSAALIL